MAFRNYGRAAGRPRSPWKTPDAAAERPRPPWLLSPSSRRGAQDQATRTAGTRSPPMHGTRLGRALAIQPPWRASRADRGGRHRNLVPRPETPSRGLSNPSSRRGTQDQATRTAGTRPPFPARHAAQPRLCHPATWFAICAGPRYIARYGGPTVRQSTEHARGSGTTPCPPLAWLNVSRQRQRRRQGRAGLRFMARMLGCRAGFRLALALCGT